MTPITVKTPAQLAQLNSETYIMGVIVGVVCLLIAAIISISIKYQGGANPTDPRQRRVWYYMFLLLSFISFFLYNKFSVSASVAPNLQAKFMITNLIGSVIAFLTCLIAGVILSKIVFPRGKLSDWYSFGKK